MQSPNARVSPAVPNVCARVLAEAPPAEEAAIAAVGSGRGRKAAGTTNTIGTLLRYHASVNVFSLLNLEPAWPRARGMLSERMLYMQGIKHMCWGFCSALPLRRRRETPPDRSANPTT